MYRALTAQEAIRERHRVLIKYAGLSMLAMACSFVALVSYLPGNKVCQYVAYSHWGDRFVMGEGKTCADAVNDPNKLLPPQDWREIKMEHVWR